MRKYFAFVLCFFLMFTNLLVIPVFATTQEDADKQAESFASVWQQSGKKASDFEHTVLMKVTAYGTGAASMGGEQYGNLTATGGTVKQGQTIAVDPKYIPYGSDVLMGGHIYKAEDCGGAIKGAIIDLYLDGGWDAWGVRYMYVSWSSGSEPSPASGTPAVGSDVSSTTIGDTAQNTKTNEVSASAVKDATSGKFFRKEDDIPGLKKKQSWGGEDITLADGSDLTSSEQLALTQWGQDITSSTETTVLTFVRAFVASFGLWLILYCLFMYLSYWVDRVNNFVEINLLGIMSFGKLVVSPDDETSTFTPTNKGSRIVVHRDMMKIVCVGLATGVLILTGKIYLLLSTLLSLVEKVKDLF